LIFFFCLSIMANTVNQQKATSEIIQSNIDMIALINPF
jgi:hypothetical protein